MDEQSLDTTQFDELRLLIEAQAKDLADRYSSLALQLCQENEKELYDRKTKRRLKENEWLQAEALMLGNLACQSERYRETPFVKAAKGRRRPDVNIVRQKVRIAEAAVVTGQFGGGDKNWNLRESASPEYVVEDVTSPAVLMEREIEDQYEATDYGRNSRAAILNYCLIGSGIMKGPQNLGKLKKKWEPIGQDFQGRAVWNMAYSSEFVPGATKVDHWFLFPNSDATCPEDITDTIELHPYTSKQLRELAYNSGFIGQNVDAILKKGIKDLSETYIPDIKHLSSNWEAWQNRFLVMERYCKVSTELLNLFNQINGLPTKEYSTEKVFCEVWTCQDEILRMEEPQLEACRRPPYYIVNWERDPGSVFGYGCAVMMADQQRVVTTAWHMLLDNAEVSSGPQVAINKKMIEAADGDTSEIRGWKVWEFTGYGEDDIRQAIQFFEVPNYQEQLSGVLNMAREFADVESGIPMIAGGMEGPGMEGGATGAAIRKQSANSILFQKITDWDDYITRPLVQAMYEWNMTYNPKDEIKGDFEIDVDSTSSALKRDLETQALEKLSVEASQNPALGMAINMDELTRTRLQMMKLSNRKIVKTPEEIKQAQEEAANQPNPEMEELELRKQELQIKQTEVALKGQQLEFERSQNQQREAWEHEERMATVEARNYENQVDYFRAQADIDMARYQLAIKNEESMASIDKDLLIHADKMNVEKLRVGVEIEQKARDQALIEQEQAIKRKQGSGI